MKPLEIRIDREPGLVKPTHGDVGVRQSGERAVERPRAPQDRPTEHAERAELRVIQRGNDPHHREIVPTEAANIDESQYRDALGRIRTVS